MNESLGPAANAVEFERRFVLATEAYQKKFRPLLLALQQAQDPESKIDLESDQNLEAHIRPYVVDPLLSALNWTIDDNLMIEAMVRSKAEGTRRRLDYLGVESQTSRPLLIVEAKRPNAHLPRPLSTGAFQHSAILASAFTLLKKDRKAALDLVQSWQDWVLDLFDYVVSLQTRPVRVAMTNGYWLIILEDPGNAFWGEEPANPATISIYENYADIRRNASRIFESLDYLRMVPFGSPLEPAQLLALVAPADVDFAMHALLVTYANTPTGLDAVPTIHVVPELLIYQKGGRWLRVTSNQKFRMPHRENEMPEHLKEVEGVHAKLLKQVGGALGREIRIAALDECYEEVSQSKYRPGVQQATEQSFLVTTGSHTHFIVARSEHKGCPFHSASAATAQGAAPSVVVRGPSAQHVTHFGDGSDHHCAHKIMQQFKESQVKDFNRDRFMPRGQIEDGPFCKIWRFERILCCQTCAFRNVCQHAFASVMPCSTAS